MFLLIALQGFSANVLITEDTLVPVPIRFMRNALQSNDSLRVMIRERDSLLALKVKYETLEVKDSLLIATLDKNIKLSDRLIQNLEAQISNSEKQSSNKDLIVLNLEKIIRRKNWLIVKITGISVSIIGTLTYLLIKK